MKQIYAHKITASPKPPNFSWCHHEPWTLTWPVYKSCFLHLCLGLSPFPLHFLPAVVRLPLGKSFSKNQTALQQRTQRGEKGRYKCYCTCCGGNNLKMNNAFWVPWGTYVFFTFSPSLYLLGRCGWAWISIKEQAQQQQTLKELTGGWIKYVFEWGSVVNDWVGWDLIPIWSF